MKKYLLFLVFLIFCFDKVEAQVPDSIVHVSGRIFNGASNEYFANTEIWVEQSYKIVTNDTGFFELNFNRAGFFPSNNILNLNVKNCDGWWKSFNISLSSNFMNDFNNIVLTVCDSILNTTPNAPATLSPLGSYFTYEIVTNISYEYYAVDEDFGGGFFFDEIYIYDFQEGVKRLMLFDSEFNLISDNFVPVGITESQIPCDFWFSASSANTSDLEVSIYSYDIRNPFSSFSWTCNGISTPVEDRIMQVSTPGFKEVCMISSIANTCELQKCDTLTVFSAEQLCNATFQIENEFGYFQITPLYRESGGDVMGNADSMIITVNGNPTRYDYIEPRDIYLQKVAGNEVCLKVFRNGCIDEECQTIDIPSQPAPANCIVPLNNYLGGYLNNKLWARTFPNIVANSFLWDFGDGTTSNEPSVTHVYSQDGTFYVSLTTTFNSCTATSYDTIVIDLSSGCEEDFNHVKYSENRCYLWSSLAYNYLQNQDLDFNWVADGNIFGTGSTIKYQFPEDTIYNICFQYSLPNICVANICEPIDLSTDSLSLKIMLDGFEPTTDFSDSKLVLYEFITNIGQVPSLINEDFELGFAVRDTINIDSNGLGIFDNIFRGYYGVKFIPGSAIGDTTILPSYTDKQLLWDQMMINSINGYPYNNLFHIEKRTLTDNLGTGLVIGNVNFGPFKLSRDENPLQSANLILMHKNNPVRFLALNGNNNFQLSNLSNGAYTLVLDLPGYKTSTANFVISEENQAVNVSLNYDQIAFDDFTPPIATSIESQNVNDFVLFPNPTNGQLYLSNVSGNGVLRITDISGKNVEVPQYQSSENAIHIDVSRVQAGIYFLIYTNIEGGKVFKKFMRN